MILCFLMGWRKKTRSLLLRKKKEATRIKQAQRIFSSAYFLSYFVFDVTLGYQTSNESPLTLRVVLRVGERIEAEAHILCLSKYVRKQRASSMTWYILLQIILLGIGLSADAFSVALADGLTYVDTNKKRCFFIAAVF